MKRMVGRGIIEDYKTIADNTRKGDRRKVYSPTEMVRWSWSSSGGSRFNSSQTDGVRGRHKAFKLTYDTSAGMAVERGACWAGSRVVTGRTCGHGGTSCACVKHQTNDEKVSGYSI